MSITDFQLSALRHEYTALVKVAKPGADILDRIGYLEQTFDMVALGEIKIEKENI